MPAAEQLVIDRLTIRFGNAPPVVRDVSFTVAPGESFGLVGESGSGKSLTCRAILGLLPGRGKASGLIRYGERSLLGLGGREMQALRGSTIGMVFQDPMTALNPVARVGESIAQVIRDHERTDSSTARTRAIELMRRVGIRDADNRARAFPHQFSGGMRQRIVVAMALAARPTLLLADEPTTALDVIVQAGILRLLDRLRREEGMSLLLVSHDFGVIASLCERIGVMYAGQLVEVGPTAQVFFDPQHPYTIGLVESLPEIGEEVRLRSILGQPPEPAAIPAGCAFAARCPLVTAECSAGPIPLTDLGGGRAARCIHLDRTEPLRVGLTLRRGSPIAPSAPNVGGSRDD